MNKPWYRLFIYPFTIVWDLVSWLAIVLIWAFWGESIWWESSEHGNPVLATVLKKDSWPDRTWFSKWGGMCIGAHAVFYGAERGGKNVWSWLQEHEHVHCKQVQGYMVAGAIQAIIVALVTWTWWALFVVWVPSFILPTIGNWIVAPLRGEPVYRGSHHEEAAYAIVEQLKRDG